jgi:hypothetical protein
MPACPMCAEEIKADATKCPFCKESIGDKAGLRQEDLAPEPKKTNVALIVAIVCVVLALPCMIAVIAAIAIPNLIEARKHGNEASAIGALKTINTSQTLFREGDKDDDGMLDYAANLQELSQATLIDGVLGTGTKQGYLFQVYNAPQTPEFLWMATANPAVPGTTGDRYFATNHAGVIYYSRTTPFALTEDCSMPADAVPVGR